MFKLSKSLILIIEKYKDDLAKLVTEIKKEEDLIQEVMNVTSFLNEINNMSARVYCLTHNITAQPKCECGKDCSFLKINRGFNKSCCSEECTHNVRSKSSIESNKNKDWKDIRKRTLITNNLKFGADSNLSRDSSVYYLYEEKMMDKFGCKSPLQNKDILAKKQLTTLKNEGTLDIIHSDKSLNTMNKLYDVNNAPLKNKDIANNAAKNQKETKFTKILNKIEKLNCTYISNNDDDFLIKCNICVSVFNISRKAINSKYKNIIKIGTICDNCKKDKNK